MVSLKMMIPMRGIAKNSERVFLRGFILFLFMIR